VKALGGLLFRGATLTEYDDLALGTGAVGRPVWNRTALLADLELRLGIPPAPSAHGVRLQQWSRRLAETTAGSTRFFSKSYELDPIGTATTLLGWRDQLIDAGWNGEAVAGGGARLEALVEIEQGLSLPLGPADRLRRVEAELASTAVSPWDELTLAEELPAWPERWRRVFASLCARGTRLGTTPPRLLAGAPPESDLGQLQASIRGEPTRVGFRGDGSVVLLTGETSWELAHSVAAVLRQVHGGSSVVVRGGDVLPLATAFSVHGLAGQGLDSASAWRPACQLLPLALELAFAPRDPYRMLELVTLPLGPFEGWVGLQLARAISQSPGIGGRAWLEAKRTIAGDPDRASSSTQGRSAVADQDLERRRAARLEQIAEWLEEPGDDADEGAPRPRLLEVSARVASYLKKRLARAAIDSEAENARGSHDQAILGAAFAQAQAFHEALSHDARQRLDLVAVRQLIEEVSLGPVALPLGTEDAGRIDLVDAPACLRCSRDVVVWWHCVSGTEEAPPVDPWRRAERQALEAIGVRLPDRTAALAAEVLGWRRVVLAADRQLLLVVPATAQGAHLDPHPIWDELVARMRADAADVTKVTLTSDELLTGGRRLARLMPTATETLAPLALPAARPVWRVDGSLLGNFTRYSATSLEELLGCPLTWVFRHRAGLGGSWALSIANGPLLNGRLGHRLIEVLHLAGTLMGQAGKAELVAGALERLIDEEGAVLRRPGMTFELSQLRQQLLVGVKRLAELLETSGLSIAEVESKTVANWGGRTLEGRLDLLLSDAAQREIVLDVKWGRTSYQQKLQRGLALQLAVYSAARQMERGHTALPAVAYFALGSGVLLSTERGLFPGIRPIDGPSAAQTWSNLERTVTAVERLLRSGVVPVTGVAKSLPLLETAGVEDSERERHVEPDAPCDYCGHKALCGQAWEHLS
jgi:ATP-dependent helicase/nuclease subunit B